MVERIPVRTASASTLAELSTGYKVVIEMNPHRRFLRNWRAIVGPTLCDGFVGATEMRTFYAYTKSDVQVKVTRYLRRRAAQAARNVWVES